MRKGRVLDAPTAAPGMAGEIPSQDIEEFAMNDERAGRYDDHPPTDGFPAYEPPPAGAYPSQPQWSTPAAAVVGLRLRDHLLVALSIVVAVALVSAIGYMWVGDSFTVRPVADQQSTGDGAPAASEGEQASPQAGAVDLRQNGVFLASNSPNGNVVVAYTRNQDGTLREVGRYPTGGKGSGSIEDVSQALVLGTSEGQASPIQILDRAELLFVPNSGSNTVSVFRVKPDGLELASQTASGGEKPVSIAVSKGLLYVLNSGEHDDRFLLGGGEVIENCTTGQLPSVSGFKVAPDGVLTPIADSTRLLTEERDSGCAAIGFTPDGRWLIATERLAGKTDAVSGWPKGAILTYAVRENGTLAPPVISEPAGAGPYGFTFTKDGTILMAEQNGAHLNEAGGLVSSYKINADGTTTPIGGPVASLGTDTCWMAVTTDQKLVFASNPAGDGGISSFSLGKDGRMSLLHPDSTDVNDERAGLLGVVFDLGLTKDNAFLYVLDSFTAEVLAFRVNGNGTLTLIEKKQAFDITPVWEGGSGGGQGISVI